MNVEVIGKLGGGYLVDRIRLEDQREYQIDKIINNK
jgi:hypothetical protein